MAIPTPVEDRLERLAARLATVERRLADLEGRATGVVATEPGPLSPLAVEVGPEEARRPAVPARAGSVGEAVPLVGRIFLVLAGAFLLRALTEMGILPDAAGSTLGILYALTWIIAADRAARAGRALSATFHGVAATLIAFPLLWEVTVKFGFIEPPAAAVGTLIIACAGLLVAAARRLRAMAWVVTLGATAGLLALAVSTDLVTLFAAGLVVVGFVTLWLGFTVGWTSLAWCSAGAADALVLLATAIGLMTDPAKAAGIVGSHGLVVLQLGLVIAYLGSFAVRTVLRNEGVTVPQILQGIAAMAIGMGGSVALTRSLDLTSLPLGAVAALLAAGYYTAAFSVVDTDERRNFVFYSSLSVAFALVALVALFHGPAMPLAFAAAGLVAAALGGRFRRATLSLHAALYILAAAVTSGVVTDSMRALFATVPSASEWITAPIVATLAVSAIYCWIPVATHGRTWGRYSTLPKVVVLVILSLGLSGIAVTLAASAITLDETGQPDPALLAVLRTTALAIAALLLAWAGRSERLAQAAWLVYPVLIAGGGKLLFEDLRSGRAATLFVSLGVYGAALILAPRITRRGN